MLSRRQETKELEVDAYLTFVNLVHQHQHDAAGAVEEHLYTYVQSIQTSRNLKLRKI